MLRPTWPIGSYQGHTWPVFNCMHNFRPTSVIRRGMCGRGLTPPARQWGFPPRKLEDKWYVLTLYFCVIMVICQTDTLINDDQLKLVSAISFY